MRAYVPSPDLHRPMGSDVPLVKIEVADNVCSDDAYTLTFPKHDNRYMTALQITLTDDDCDEILEKLAEARLARIRKQEQTYEALHAKFGGSWNNGALADTNDPDGPETDDLYTDDDVPAED